jgi:hypothetical protein
MDPVDGSDWQLRNEYSFFGYRRLYLLASEKTRLKGFGADQFDGERALDFVDGDK